MAHYKIDSVGWKSVKKENGVNSIIFYALVISIDNPEFQFALELPFSQVLAQGSKKYPMINKIIDIGIKNKMFKESILMEDLKGYSFKIKQLAREAFETLYDIEKEGAKAAVKPMEDLSTITKVVHKLKKSKPALSKKKSIYYELFILLINAINTTLVKQYPKISDLLTDYDYDLDLFIDISIFDLVDNFMPIIFKDGNLIFDTEKNHQN